MNYQDVRVKGRVVSRGYRDCEGRYQFIRQALLSMGSGFTVLDVGASDGYFSVRLAEDFGAWVTAVERRKPSTSRMENPRVTWHRVTLAPKDLIDWSFDVVLALSVLHHMADWRDMLAALHQSARRCLVVETPHPDERLRQAVARDQLQDIDRAVRTLGARVIGSAPGVWDKNLTRNLYIMEKP